LYAGVRDPERRVLKKLLKTFTHHPVTARIAVRGGKLRRQYLKSHQLELADTLIAGTAEELGLEMVTRNAKHYPMMNVTVPYAR
jgi:predicted nucleic acid-binding protein